MFLQREKSVTERGRVWIEVHKQKLESSLTEMVRACRKTLHERTRFLHEPS